MRPEVALRHVADPALRNLAEQAVVASQRAYAKYSEFKVGAAVLTTRGNVYCGCNVENDSYGLTSCAERNAIFAAVAGEGPRMRVTAVAVYANDERAHTVPPCGACRQVLAQFGLDATIIFPEGARFATRTVRELLPVEFRLKRTRRAPP